MLLLSLSSLSSVVILSSKFFDKLIFLRLYGPEAPLLSSKRDRQGEKIGRLRCHTGSATAEKKKKKKKSCQNCVDVV